MDRSLPSSFTQSIRRKRWIWAFIAVVAIVLTILAIRMFFHASVSRASIQTAQTGKGDIENTLTASGEVLPEFEEVITSPVSASILEVSVAAGASVKEGQPLLKLDKAAVESELEKGKFLLEQSRNNIRKLRLQLDKSYFDLQTGNNIKQLRIQALQADVENARRLYKAGGGTRESVEQAETSLRVAQLEKAQLENEIKNKQEAMQVEMRESELESAIQGQALGELKRKLDRAGIVAPRGGVVTWVNRNIGTTVREGEPLVRIADLQSFKVTGTIADNYSDKLSAGMPVIIRIQEQSIRGRVQSVHPTVQNSSVTFDILLDERHHPSLRPNLKVDVYPVTAAGRNVLRAPNGPAFNGVSPMPVYVVQGNKAVRRMVQTGMSNFDYVEIKSGLNPGETFILSDMSQFRHAKEINIQ
ncbi:efflux RND transporter periplasmic adaptor subunit [Chitinophaga deserti]|uniref:efflux RND transporter periplasmic adaptor subunit n=1 Tax=Chitinophaga deserti TaxID=2164099 RepID=UPI000D6CB5F5|nr:HlyD family efflux transporter periplasmic adaptor subunit [Chitinophaga deserti]